MKRVPITHLILDTSSSSPEDNGECDFCLIPMTADYIAYLLGYMDEVRGLHRIDSSVYSLECWDGSAAYFQDNDRLAELRDVDGNPAGDVPRGEPILLTADPKFKEEDFQRVDCQTVQILSDDVWWTAYVRHTSIRIESAHVEKKTLLRILRSLGGARAPAAPARPAQKGAKPVHPAIQHIHDLLYLDMKNGRELYDSEKNCDSDTLTAIAEVVAKFIPRPKSASSTSKT